MLQSANNYWSLEAGILAQNGCISIEFFCTADAPSVPFMLHTMPCFKRDLDQAIRGLRDFVHFEVILVEWH